MPAELVNLIGAAGALMSWALGQAWIAPLAAGSIGGYTLARAKNQTAVTEIVRAVFFAGFAWFFIGAVQALIAQGV
jgi:hypothetical protein